MDSESTGIPRAPGLAGRVPRSGRAMIVSRLHLWACLLAAGVLVHLVTPAFLGSWTSDILVDSLVPARERWCRGRAQDRASVVVVAVDDSTLAEAKERWPFRTSTIARAVRRLSQDGAAAIGLAMRYDRPSLDDAAGDRELVEAIRASGNVVLKEEIPLGMPSASSPLGWDPSFTSVAAGSGATRLAYGMGGTVRGIVAEWSGFPLSLARMHRSGSQVQTSLGQIVISAPGREALRAGLAEGQVLHVEAPAAAPIECVSLAALLSGRAARSRIEGRIAIVGPTAPGAARLVAVSGSGGAGGGAGSGSGASASALAEAALDAALVERILAGRALHVAGAGPRWALFLALVAVLGLVAGQGSLARFAAGAGLAVGLQVAMPLAAHVFWGWRPELLEPLLGLAAAVVVLSAARLWEAVVLSGKITAVLGDAARDAAGRMYTEAVELARAGQHTLAIELLQKVMRTDPVLRNKAISQLLGCYLDARELELVEDTFAQIAQDQLALAESYDLGLKLVEAGYFDEARALFMVVYNRDVTFRDVKHQLELVKQAQASRKDVVERLIVKDLRKDYQSLELVRRGGMALVYRGYMKSMDRVVAIKILTPHLNDDANLVRRFFLEAETLKGFDHPNIIKVFKVHNEGTLRYYAMEHVHPAITLYDLIDKERKLSVARAVHILKQVCLALEYSHARRVIHRDVKPQNILVAASDQAKLIDFGIARFEALSTMTMGGMVMGTPRYMSPEQLKGDRVDEATDVYSCGVVFFEMLTGITGTENPMVEKVKGRTSIYQLILRQNLPTPVVRVVLKCLEGHRSRRYASARELHDDLAAFEKLPAGALGL
jgi:CHASE2 domain-containing sensor protein/tRNA A-37 threonylcarbamoyl transferase component Bud32